MIDPEKNVGKTDLGYTLRIDEAPSPALRDWLENDLFVELHTSFPKIVSKQLEEGQQESVKDVVLDADEKPMIETKMLGVSAAYQNA